MTTTATAPIAPADVHRLLARHMLADGLDLVFDYDKSHGSWVYDSRHGREYLDFMTFFGSTPIGYNHPKMKDPEFLRVLSRVAQLKPSLADVYTVEYAWFVETFARIAIPSHLQYAFFIEGGALAVENALKVAFDWKVRRNRARGRGRREGTADPALPRGLPRPQRLHALAHQHRSQEDRALPQVPLAARGQPQAALPGHGGSRAGRGRGRAAARWSRCARPSRTIRTTSPPSSSSPSRPKAATTTSGPAFLQALERFADEHECFFIVDEVQTGIGLTGKMWAHEHFGLTPDALAFGKKMQVCGCLVGPKVDEEPENVFKVLVPDQLHLGRRPHRHGALRRGSSRSSRRTAWSTTRAWSASTSCSGLQGVQEELGGIMSNARGRGLMIAFDLPTPELRKKAHEALIANGLLLLTCGPRSIRFRPPLNLSAAEADTALDIVRKSLKAL